EELLARIRVHLRQGKIKQPVGDVLEVGDLHVNLSSRDVKRKNILITLTPREYDLLVYLLENKNIVLTREQLIEQVWGFDYFGELLARIRVHLRQGKIKQPVGDVLEVGDLHVNLSSRDVKRKNILITLTPREYDLLVYLLENKNIVLTREQLIEQVWGFDYFG